MENKFDKEIQELFRAYQEQPSANCWDKVSSQLDAMQNIPDVSQSSGASSANGSAFSQFVGSVVGKITIAVTSVAAIGGLSYLIVTSDSQDSVQTITDTTSNVEIPVEENKEENTIVTIIEQAEASNEVEETVTVRDNSVTQEEQQIEKEDNKNLHSSSNSTSDNNRIAQNQAVIVQTSEAEAKNQPEASNKQEVVKPKQEKKETSETQKAIPEQSNTAIENPKEEITNENPPIDVSKIHISNLLTPNGDGENDYFIIGNIDEYPDNNLIIFRRDNGKVIYEKANYRNEWNADNIPDGVYYYMFSFTHEGRTYMRQGSITVKR